MQIGKSYGEDMAKKGEHGPYIEEDLVDSGDSYLMDMMDEGKEEAT